MELGKAERIPGTVKHGWPQKRDQQPETAQRGKRGPSSHGREVLNGKLKVEMVVSICLHTAPTRHEVAPLSCSFKANKRKYSFCTAHN